ncbi:hypothetical protein [Sphingosinicella terrae]|uniref:hypothetical protein n=1 Tax=Sphingosinicella terrae TaxID=2172047 RepID=UPI000E0D46E6|nr:hypothetical protein [Sphingosinicella terrae]
MSAPRLRATDPGVRLSQFADLKWVHCPRCDGPARLAGERLTCLGCAYSEGGPTPNRRRLRELVLAKARPKCPNRRCGAPLPDIGKAVRGGGGDNLEADVRCPTCREVSRHPALALTPRDAARGARRFWRAFYRRGHSLYLARRVGTHVLAVYNVAHLDALEAWLGADLRERGPVAGLTMMARLPRWMKAASNRPLVRKALAELREQAAREGLG